MHQQVSTRLINKPIQAFDMMFQLDELFIRIFGFLYVLPLFIPPVNACHSIVDAHDFMSVIDNRSLENFSTNYTFVRILQHAVEVL